MYLKSALFLRTDFVLNTLKYSLYSLVLLKIIFRTSKWTYILHEYEQHEYELKLYFYYLCIENLVTTCSTLKPTSVWKMGSSVQQVVT